MHCPPYHFSWNRIKSFFQIHKAKIELPSFSSKLLLHLSHNKNGIIGIYTLNENIMLTACDDRCRWKQSTDMSKKMMDVSRTRKTSLKFIYSDSRGSEQMEKASQVPNTHTKPNCNMAISPSQKKQNWRHERRLLQNSPLTTTPWSIKKRATFIFLIALANIDGFS